MKIVHISFARINSEKPVSGWLRDIAFFTGILHEIARHHEVFSIHFYKKRETVQDGKITFDFFRGDLFSRLFCRRALMHIASISPDVVIVHGIHFSWQTFLLRFFVKNARVFIQHHAERPFGGIRKYFQKRNDLEVNGYFFTSRQLALPWIENGLIRDQKKVHEVMEGSSSFSSGLAPLRQRGSYIWIGRLDRNKDPLTLLKAFVPFAKKNPFVALTMIYTDDELLPDVKRLAAEASRQIRLIGKVEHDEIQGWLVRNDFIVSTSHYEGSGFAICEGMSCGCIPIATSIPSLKSMAENCGLFFAPGDISGLRSALEESLRISVAEMRARTLAQFRDHLSFKAISKKIIDVVSLR